MQMKKPRDIPHRPSRKTFAAVLAATLIIVAAALAFKMLPAEAETGDPPAEPTGLSASGVSSDSVTLNWDDPGDSSITGYQALRRSRDGSEYGDGEGAAEFAVIADDTGSAATTYTDASVTPRTRYVYRVKAINPAGTSGQSPYLNVETLAAPTPPAAPTGLAVSSEAHDSVTLTWNDPADSKIESYQILRRSRDGTGYGDGEGAAEFAVIEENTGSAAVTHTDSSVTARTRYAYSVKAISAAGTSGQSGYLNVDTPEAPPDRPLSPARGSRPNVVLILADDLGWGDVETNNPDSAMTTPRIDGIAAAGVNFTDAHSPSSNCTGTRYGLLTGRYAWRTWLTSGVLNGYDRPLIGPDRPTLGTLLRGHGYRTAAVGKWHLGMDFARLPSAHEITEINRGIDFDAEILDSPVDHGFDEFFGTSANLTWNVPAYIRDNRFTANPDRGNQPESGLIRAKEVLGRLTEEGVGFIERAAPEDDPFFLYLPLNAPHVPMAPNDHFRDSTGLGLYGDFVAQIDWTVGQVLDALERTGASENTLVIFTSDNGSYMGGLPNHMSNDHTENPRAFYYRYDTHQSNGGWFGLKGTINEGGHRVPLLLQWPRKIEAGSTVDATVSLTDLYATLADIMEEEPESGVATDSLSLLPLLLGESETRGTPVVHYSGAGMFALRDGRWKLVFGNGRGSLSGMANGEPFGTPWRLYDLEQDPREVRNTARANPAVMARMEAALDRIRSTENGTLPANAALSKLSLAGIDIGAFNPDEPSYSATVDRGIETVEVTALPTETDAGVSISTPEGRLLYGKPQRGRVEVGLAESSTTITITVEAPDKSATATYTVTVTRAGEAAIAGIPLVGETLTADTSGIADEDGLSGASFIHQWVSNDGIGDTDIEGATSATYVLTAEDLGKTIRVRVSFTDDAGHEETLTSPATATVRHPEDVVAWEGELTAGQDAGIIPVRSGYSSFGDLGGILSPDTFVLDETTYRVQFLVHVSGGLWLGMTGELPVDFTLQVGDSAHRGSESKVPRAISLGAYWWASAPPGWSADGPVQVSLTVHPDVPLGDRQKAPVAGYFRDAPAEHGGDEDFSFRIYFTELVSTTAGALRDHVLAVTGGAVSGVEAVGDDGRIWAVSVTPESADAVTIEIEAGLDCELSGAVCTADGRRLFNRMELRVEPMEKNPPTGAPIIRGTVEAGQTLTADTSGIADADGLTGATFSYQWVSYDGNADTDIPGAAGPTYTLVPADEGKSFRVRVSFTDDAGFEESLTSALFGSEQPYGLNASASDGAVALTWQLPAGWPYSSTFQILRNRPELGETEPLVLVKYLQSPGNTYTDTDVESGVLYVYRVQGVDPFGYTGEASELVEIRAGESTPVENTPATGAPAVSGAVQVGGTLTADTSDITDEDGLSNPGYTYQWVRNDANGDTDIESATNATYVLADADLGKAIRVRANFTDDAGNEEILHSAATAAVAAAPPSNSPATGAPTISGTAQVGETLTADTTGISDADGLDNADFDYQWLAGDTAISGAISSTYTLVAADEGRAIKVEVSFTDDGGNDESVTSAATAQQGTCSGGGYDPMPVEVDVTAVPIVVESTTDEYFVLYVRHELDADTTVELPVAVSLGEEGTTTLAENVAALPKERYRVEKHLIADPADVDGDCIDDITELANPVGQNPVNPAAAVELSDGAVAVPDQETFETISFGKHHLKFILFGIDTDSPSLYFLNTKTHQTHHDFLRATGLELSLDGLISGDIFYHSTLFATDDSPGGYRFLLKFSSPISVVARSYTVLAASMPLLKDNLAFHMAKHELPYLQPELPLYRASRINLVFDEDVWGDTDFLALNPGEGYGRLQALEPDDRPHPRDVVIYETLPNELPRVAGIISTVPQTPLSHVNLRAVQDGVPNAFILGALDEPDIDALIGSYVHYTVTSDGYTIRAATRKEIEDHYASSRPTEAQTPERDLSVREITPLSEIGFDDWKAFGVKAANVAVLGTLGFPEGTVPDGFAVPFYFYDEFMKANGLYDDIEEMLADTVFQTDFDTQESELKKLRKKIKKAETPQWIIDALTQMHETFPEGTSLRYRSSTNNEDLPGFSGAGLYDSKTQDPEETEDDGIDKSIKGVWASLWNFRAFVERDFHRIDHTKAAMGVLVHPNYSDEKVNGVAVSFDPVSGRGGVYYVNSQIGEDLVTNPEAHSTPEEIRMYRSYRGYTVLATSNLLPPGELLMSDAQLDQLRSHLIATHEHFKELYEPESGEPFAMEIEFKITSDNILAIKQARPWIFGAPNQPQSNQPPAFPATERGVRSVAENMAAGQALGAPVAAVDPNTDDTLTYSLSGDDDASFDIVASTGQLQARAALDYETEESYTVTVSVHDGKDANGDTDTTIDDSIAVTILVNRPATDAPTISGTAQVEETLTAGITGISDPDGLDNAQFDYQWLADDAAIIGATSSTYTLVAADEGKTIKVKVSFTDDAGNPEAVTSDATAAVAAKPNTPATGAPAIGGTAQVGEALTADTSGIADADGLDNAVFSYQWIANDGTIDADISGATESTYTLKDTDEGNRIRVRASFTDDEGNPETLTSAATAAVAGRPPEPLTASLENTPTSHDGEAAFTFELRFSEEPHPHFSYKTLRDHAFTVTGGAVKKAQRLDKPSNILWRITVEPDSDAAVAMILPVTTDCNSTGAFCTSDGRMLSNRLELTVNGPGG